jgi:hypothetical protein
MERFMIRGFLMLCLFGLVLGCGGGPTAAKLAEVSGTVKVDGQPIPEGSITFHGDTPGSQPFSMDIKNGSYSGKATLGIKRVQFASLKEVVQKFTAKDGPGYDTADKVQNVLPSKFTTESKEVAEVKEGANKIDFDLKTK